MSDPAPVLILGSGVARFGRRDDATFEDLLCEAVFMACWDAGCRISDIDAAVLAASDLGDRYHGAAILSEATGVSNVPVTRVSGGGVAGGDAFRCGALAVLSGEHRLVLVAGAIKQTQHSAIDNLVRRPVSRGHPVLARGLSPVGAAALFARRMIESDLLTHEHLDAVAVKSRVHASVNPEAYRRGELTLEAIEAAPVVADPLTSLHVAPPVDGAAAVVLSSRPGGETAQGAPILVKGVGHSVAGGEILPFFDAQQDLLTRPAARAACFQAYTKAGLVSPWSEIEVIEVDDRTAIGELLAYEDLSLCGAGESGAVIEQGFTAVGSQLPVNPEGGTLALGTAPPADVLRRIHEVVRQLQGRAGDCQVEGARTGVAHGAEAAGNEGFVAVLTVFAGLSGGTPA